MSYKIKSSLYFASFIITALTYYTICQADAQQLAMQKEINTIENQTTATPNDAELHTL